MYLRTLLKCIPDVPYLRALFICIRIISYLRTLCMLTTVHSTLALRARMAVSLFLCWDRSLWLNATRPVGRCVILTALSVVFTCWPPAPCARMVSIFSSFAGISTFAAPPARRVVHLRLLELQRTTYLLVQKRSHTTLK